MTVLFKLLIGKNLPHLSRRLATFVGGLLIASVLFVQNSVEFPTEFQPIPGESIALPSPSEAEVRDGVSVGELLRVVIGVVMVFAARVTSFLRAKNLGVVANVLGPLIGRSLPSLFRAGLTLAASFLAFLTGMTGFDLGEIEGMQVTAFVGFIMSWLATSLLSMIEDGKRNPIG